MTNHAFFSRIASPMTAAICGAVLIAGIGSQTPARAGGMDNIHTDAYQLSGQVHGYPISILQQIVIDRAPVRKSVASPPLPKFKTPNLIDDKTAVTPHKFKNTDPAPPKDPFDPAIYTVYGVMTGDDGASAIVGLIGGDAEVLHVGQMIGKTSAMVSEINPEGVVVTFGAEHSTAHIGFTGGDKITPVPLAFQNANVSAAPANGSAGPMPQSHTKPLPASWEVTPLPGL